MKSGLIAVNNDIALYERTERMADESFDAYCFIDELLSIRTAYGLVRFLSRENTAAFSRQVGSVDDLSVESKKFTVQGDAYPLYNKGSLVSAADRCGIDYLDGMTAMGNLYGKDDAYLLHRENVSNYMSRWNADHLLILKERFPQERESNACFINLSYLARIKNGLQTLLTYASVALGDGEIKSIVHHACESEILGFRVHQKDRECLYVHIDESILYPFLLLGDEEAHEQLSFFDEDSLKLSPKMDGTKLIDGERVMPPSVRNFGNRCFITDYESIGENVAARMLCGAVSAFVLTGFGRIKDNQPRFYFSLEKGIKQEHPKEDHSDMILTEVVNIIENGRVGLCEVCNLPFVMAYENGRSTSKRKTCSDSCRAKKPNPAR
ncbi:MAG: hypothetical protein RR547_12590 [Raoultibacter sp.]